MYASQRVYCVAQYTQLIICIRTLLRMARTAAVLILLLKYNYQECGSRSELKSLKFVGFSHYFTLNLQTFYLVY